MQRPGMILGAFCAMAAFQFAGCKPQPPNSEVQSLENFAAGELIKRNSCDSSPEAVKSDAVVKLMKRSFVEGPKTLRDQVEKAVAAVPRDYLELFESLGGRVRVTSQVGIYCDPILNEITGFRQGFVSEACYQLDPEPDSFAQIVVLNTPEAVGHHIVREFGFVFSQILAKSNIVVQGNKLKIQSSSGVRSDLVEIRGQLMESFLKDVVYSPHFNLETVRPFIGDHSSKIVGNVKANRAPLTGVEISSVNLERLTDFVFAESFDSYFCNAVADFKAENFQGIKPRSEDPTKLLSALKTTNNSRMIMSVLFGESFGVMGRLHGSLFGGFPKAPRMGLVESCDAGSVGPIIAPVTNFELYGGSAADEGVDRGSASAFGSLFNMDIAASTSPTMSGSRFFDSGLELGLGSVSHADQGMAKTQDFGGLFSAMQDFSAQDIAAPSVASRSSVVASDSIAQVDQSSAALQQQIKAVSTTLGKDSAVASVEAAFALAGPGDAIRKCAGEIAGNSKALSTAEELAARAGRIGGSGAGSAPSAVSKFASDSSSAGAVRPSLLQAANPSVKPVGGGVAAVPGAQTRPIAIGNESSLSPAELKFREEQWAIAKKLPTIEQKYGPLVESAIPNLNRGTGSTDVMANFKAVEKAAEDAREFAKQARAADRSTALPTDGFNQWTRYSYHQAKVREAIDAIPDASVRQRVLERYQSKLNGF
jgi:hypothetical protein